MKKYYKKEMEKRVHDIFDQKKNGPVQLKKMKPLSQTDVLDMYAELGMDPHLHEGFYDLNTDFKVKR